MFSLILVDIGQVNGYYKNKGKCARELDREDIEVKDSMKEMTLHRVERCKLIHMTEISS